LLLDIRKYGRDSENNKVLTLFNSFLLQFLVENNDKINNLFRRNLRMKKAFTGVGRNDSVLRCCHRGMQTAAIHLTLIVYLKR
jgi:hypothetical protein